MTVSAQQWHKAQGTDHVYPAAIAASWGRPETLYTLAVRSFDNGYDNYPLFLRSLDGGLSWDSISTMGGGSLCGMKVDPSDARIIYVSHEGVDPSGNDFEISTDGGLTWRLQFSGRRFPASVVEVDPVDRRTVYVTPGPMALWKSTDQGVSWQAIGDTISTNVTSMAIDPVNDSILWTSGIADVRKSTDKGNTFHLSLLHFHGLSKLAINPKQTNTVYISFFDTLAGVWKTTDGGDHWFDTNGDLPPVNRHLNCVIVNPYDPEQVFLGSGTPTLDRNPFLFRTTDGGAQWTRFDDGLPDSLGHVETMLFDTVYKRIFAAVQSQQGAGIYYCDYPALSVPPQRTARLPKTFSLAQNYPNPFNPSTTITFTLPEQSHIVLDVTDVLGRSVAKLADGMFEPGEHRVEFTSVGLSSGIYFYRLHTPTGIITNKMMVVR